MDIGEVAARSGVKPSALRYYEARGLIASEGRNGLRRQYDRRVLSRLALIALGQRAGFSLDEIAQTIGADGSLDIDRVLLARKAEELDRTIRELRALRDGLRHAAECPAPTHEDCPKFQRLMKVAAARVKRMARSAR
ncbi:MAG: helix-turn-helix domain-containing protein [Pseudodonghicola sp.]